jgi:hypothetical protein
MGRLGSERESVLIDYGGTLEEKEKGTFQLTPSGEKAVRAVRWRDLLHDVEPMEGDFVWFEEWDMSFMTKPWIRPVDIGLIPEESGGHKTWVYVKDRPEDAIDADWIQAEEGGYVHTLDWNPRMEYVRRAKREIYINDQLPAYYAILSLMHLVGTAHPALRLLKRYLMDTVPDADPFIQGQNISEVQRFTKDALAPVRVLVVIQWMYYDYVHCGGSSHPADAPAFIEEFMIASFLSPYDVGDIYKAALSIAGIMLGCAGLTGIRVEYPEWIPESHSTGRSVQREIFASDPQTDEATFLRLSPRFEELNAIVADKIGLKTAAFLLSLLGDGAVTISEMMTRHQIGLDMLYAMGYGRSNKMMSFNKQLRTNFTEKYDRAVGPPKDLMQPMVDFAKSWRTTRMATRGKHGIPRRSDIYQATLKAATTKSAGVKLGSVSITLPYNWSRHLRSGKDTRSLQMRSKKAYVLIRGEAGFTKGVNLGAVISIGLRNVLGMKMARAVAVVPGDVAMVTRALFLTSLTNMTKAMRLPMTTNELAGDISDVAPLLAATGNPDLMALMDDASTWDAHCVEEVWRDEFKRVMDEMVTGQPPFVGGVLGFTSLEDMIQYYLQDGNAWNAKLFAGPSPPLDFNDLRLSALADAGTAMAALYPGLASGQIYTLLFNCLAHLSIKIRLFNDPRYIKALGPMRLHMYRVLGDDTITVLKMASEPPGVDQVSEIINVAIDVYAECNQELSQYKAGSGRWASEYTKLRALSGRAYAAGLTPFTHEKRLEMHPIDAIRSDVELAGSNSTRGYSVKRMMDVVLSRWLYLRRQKFAHYGQTFACWLPFSTFVLPDGGVNSSYLNPGFASSALFNTWRAEQHSTYTRWTHAFCVRSSAQAIEELARNLVELPEFRPGVDYVRKCIPGFNSRLKRSKAVPDSLSKYVPSKYRFGNSVRTYCSGLLAVETQLKDMRLALTRHISPFADEEVLSLSINPVPFSRERYIPVFRVILDHEAPALRDFIYTVGDRRGKSPVHTVDARMDSLFGLMGVRTTDVESQRQAMVVMSALASDDGVINPATPATILGMFRKVAFDLEKCTQLLYVMGYSPSIAAQVRSYMSDPNIALNIKLEDILGGAGTNGQFEKYFSLGGNFMRDRVEVSNDTIALADYALHLGYQYMIESIFSEGKYPRIYVQIPRSVEISLITDTLL